MVTMAGPEPRPLNMSTYKHEDGWIESSADPVYQQEVDKYDRTERARRRQSRIEYQAGLPAAKSWRERELEEHDRINAMFRRHFTSVAR